MKNKGRCFIGEKRRVISLVSMFALISFVNSTDIQGLTLLEPSISEAKVVRKVTRRRVIRNTIVKDEPITSENTNPNVETTGCGNQSKKETVDRGGVVSSVEANDEIYDNEKDNSKLVDIGKSKVQNDIVLGQGADSLKGDIDCNGKITITDLSLMKRHIVYGETLLSKDNADINSDGRVTSTDLSLLKKLIIETPDKNVERCEEYVPSERYYIACALNNDKVLDVSMGSIYNKANIQIWDRNNTSAQLFSLKYDNGYYTIQNCGSKKYIDVAGGVAGSGINIWQYERNYTDAQKWVLEPAGGEYYYIRSALGYYLDVADTNLKNGTNVLTFSKNNAKRQKFKFINYIYHEHHTVDLDFSTFEEWKKKIKETEINLMGVQRFGTMISDVHSESLNVSCNFSAVNGKYIDRIEVMEYKKIRIFYDVNHLGKIQKIC